MAESLKVFELEQQGDTLIVIPKGDAGGYRYTEVHLESDAVLPCLHDSQIRNFIVDLWQVQLLGSIIIGTIIKLVRKVENVVGNSAFCNASDVMLEVLETMDCTNLWPHFATRDEALYRCIDNESLERLITHRQAELSKITRCISEPHVLAGSRLGRGLFCKRPAGYSD